MESAKILALGEFLPKDINVSVTESNRKINLIIEAKIDAIWKVKKKEAERLGQVCYNGISYRVNYLKQVGSKLEIDFGTIEFKTRMGLIEIPEYFTLPEEYYRKGCYSGATVKTSDDFYMIVELSGKSLNQHKVDLIGGLIEKPLEIRNSEGLFLSIYNELEEEACINKEDINSMYLRTVYLTTKTDVGFYFETTLKISSKELIERFQNQNKDKDIKSLRFLRREEYIKFLHDYSSSKKLIGEVIQL